jgi:hypothetical protein
VRGRGRHRRRRAGRRHQRGQSYRCGKHRGAQFYRAENQQPGGIRAVGLRTNLFAMSRDDAIELGLTILQYLRSHLQRTS